MKIVFAAIATILMMLSPTFGRTTRPVTAPAAGPAAVVELSGQINDFTAAMFEKHMAAAKAAGAKTVLVRINTPGGAVVSALRMSQFIKRQRADVRVVAVVDEMALSAGAMLAVACDEIVMQPGSMVGDCAPIVVTDAGLQTLGAAERAKMESPILAEFADSADKNRYDPLLMSSMVQYGVVVRYLQSPAGERRFVNAENGKTLQAEGWAPVAGVPDPLDGAEQLLTMNDSLAAKVGLSSATVDSPDAYAASLNLPIVGRFNTTAGEKLVGLLSEPAVRSILGMVFLWSLYTAITKPGTGVPEVIALLSGVVLVGVPLLTGYAGFVEVLLILLGVLLIALELFVIPGFGVAGVSGIILLLVGLVLTYAPPELPGGGIVPQLPGTRDAIRHGVYAVTAGLVVSSLLWIWLAKYLPQIPYMNRLVLATNVGSTADDADVRSVVDQAWPAVGEAGTTVTRLAPGGVAQFLDPITNNPKPVDVVSDVGYIDAGRAVVVRGREGSRVTVRAAGADA